MEWKYIIWFSISNPNLTNVCFLLYQINRLHLCRVSNTLSEYKMFEIYSRLRPDLPGGLSNMWAGSYWGGRRVGRNTVRCT